MQTIPAVAGNKLLVTSAEFIKLTIYNDQLNPSDVSIYTFSSAYKEETIDGQVYTPLGGLLAVGTQQRDLRVTSADTSVSLSGLQSDNIYIVLEKKVKGSKLEIIRGFYDENYVMTSTAKRFTGIVTSYSITEIRENKDDNFVVTINASSYKLVLQNRIAGRKTNQQSWNEFNPTDTSMDQIYSLADQTFDFGRPVVSGGTTQSTASTTAQQSSSTNNYDYQGM
jgi:hypothetical protein